MFGFLAYIGGIIGYLSIQSPKMREWDINSLSMHGQGQHDLIVSGTDVADARDYSVGSMCPVLQVCVCCSVVDWRVHVWCLFVSVLCFPFPYLNRVRKHDDDKSNRGFNNNNNDKVNFLAC